MPAVTVGPRLEWALIDVAAGCHYELRVMPATEWQVQSKSLQPGHLEPSSLEP
jgi:hypothetical protein